MKGSVSYLNKSTGGVSLRIEPLAEDSRHFDKLLPTRHMN
jgi:hypothetical protein